MRVANRLLFAAHDSLFALLLLLAGDRFGRALARARIGVSALTAHRQPAAMTQAAIAAEIHQPLDVHAGFTTQITFDEIVAIDHFTNLQPFLIAQLRDAAISRNLDLLDDVGRILLADAMDVLKRDQDALVGRDIHTGNTGHRLHSCRRAIRGPAVFSLFGPVFTNANTNPFPLFSGARHRLKTIRRDT